MAANVGCMSDAIDLPPVLDLVAAPGLLESFVERRGDRLCIDASRVQRLGAQCLQILLAARNAWAEDGNALDIQNPSEDFTASLELLGTSVGGLTNGTQKASGETDR